MTSLKLLAYLEKDWTAEAVRYLDGPFFHGQKPTIHGQNGIETVFTVCYGHSKQSLHSSYLYTDLNGGYFMRHFYFRLIFGIVWLAAAVVSAVKSNLSFAALYVVLGIVFLWSAHSIWKKDKDNER